MPVRSQDSLTRFQSTLPLWGGTQLHIDPSGDVIISIHPPHEGRDLTWEHWEEFCGEFQSTLPVRGGTCGTPGFEGVFAKFQSTLPVGGGTPQNFPSKT